MGSKFGYKFGILQKHLLPKILQNVQFSDKFQCTDNLVRFGCVLIEKITETKQKLIIGASTCLYVSYCISVAAFSFLHFSCCISVTAFHLLVFWSPLQSPRAPQGNSFHCAHCNKMLPAPLPAPDMLSLAGCFLIIWRNKCGFVENILTKVHVVIRSAEVSEIFDWDGTHADENMPRSHWWVHIGWHSPASWMRLRIALFFTQQKTFELQDNFPWGEGACVSFISIF